MCFFSVYLGLVLFLLTSLLLLNLLLSVLLVLHSSGLLLLVELVALDLFLLGFVDGLNEHLLVLELVTLGSKVELVIPVKKCESQIKSKKLKILVLVDFLRSAVFSQQTSQDSLSADP